jgi:diadenosine tetraphosphate (Ap4A) HIT family hydrolase
LFKPDQDNHAFLMNADTHVHLHVVPHYRAERSWGGQVFSDQHFGTLFGTEQRILVGATLASLAAAIRAASQRPPRTRLRRAERSNRGAVSRGRRNTSLTERSRRLWWRVGAISG